ncbi:MAG: hypothetical protein MJ229_02965 [bacterium]|nr:hypothetical protein [bacterium]
MNYFDLINKCLIELNYKACDNFSDLIKNDHKKIKNILNIINSEICSFDNWNFLLKKQELELPRNTSEIQNTIEGRIHSLYIDKQKYEYDSDFEKFFLNKELSNTYSVFNDKILFPMFQENKTIEIFYYTNNFVKDSDDNDKKKFENEDDYSIIPEPFVEPILVYGTCMRLKGNTEYSKFSYWYNMYKEALSTLRAKTETNALSSPTISMKRT